ncbi:hypothetical protein [Flaviaesturariibacter amylovorans]|uniref:Uncharacterized protein n=1 Tax=Flaviaesturariibacter amylovorans TaxID=1084520 RepID=A0ABP8GPH5_9BACT
MNTVKTCKKLSNARGSKNTSPLDMRKDCAPFDARTAAAIRDILYGDPLRKEDYNALSAEEKRALITVVVEGINNLGDRDLDRFNEQVKELLPEETRNATWERNYVIISNAIHALTIEYNRFPILEEIARETSLSRTTVQKHMKEYIGSLLHLQRTDNLIAMRETVLQRVYREATKGNVRAAKVFLEATAPIASTPQNIRNQQNNFIQVNGLTITREQVLALPEGTRAQLETILSLFPQEAPAAQYQALPGQPA